MCPIFGDKNSEKNGNGEMAAVGFSGISAFEGFAFSDGDGGAGKI